MRKAIIVDIDGTLAKMNGRGPFEWHRVGEDDPKMVIIHLVRLLSELHTILIFSGRDGSCEKQTKDWLFKHDVPYDALFMRPAGNFEKDNIIKRRIYDEQVKDKYDIEFVLDDRDQVVEMWRKDLGFTCLQVDYGNF